MKLFLRFVQVWLGTCFLLSFFVVPIYLIAIYPKIPEPYYKFSRLFGYGVVQAPASEFGFWYRFAGCTAVVLLGILLLFRWLQDLKEDKTRTPNEGNRSSKPPRRRIGTR